MTALGRLALQIWLKIVGGIVVWNGILCLLGYGIWPGIEIGAAVFWSGAGILSLVGEIKEDEGKCRDPQRADR